MMPRWPDDVVLSFPRPWPSTRSNADWVRTVVEADWLFRHGLDTLDIAQALSIHERDAYRAVSQGREARRNPKENGNVTSEVGSTAQVNAGGGGVAGSTSAAWDK